MTSHARGWRALRRLLLAGLGLLGLTLLALVWTADSWATGMLVRAPSPHYAPGPLPPGATALEVQRAGARIRAWKFEPPAAARGTLLVLHGIGDRKHNHLSAAIGGTARGLRTVLVDSRGHGESSGAFLTYGVEEAHDVVAMLDALAGRGQLTRPVVLRGTSYGAATAIQAAARDARVDAVIAMAPFSSLRKVVPDYLRWMLGPVSQLVPSAFVDARIDHAAGQAGFDPDAACPRCLAPRVRASVLLIHSRDDERIPYTHGVRIHDALPGRSEMLLVEGVGHNGISAGVGVAARVDAWLDELLNHSWDR